MKNIFIKTFGCSLNQSDSELMAGLLKEHGYNIVKDEKKADLVIINSCTVKNLAESKFFHEIKRFRKMKKKIVLAGCVPQAEPKLLENELKEFSVIGVNQLNKIVDVVEHTLNGNKIQIIKKEKNQRLNLPKIRKNHVIDILPINEGCMNNCAYCKTKFARGDLFSYNPNAIKKEFENAVKEGCREIWITSQDTGCYGLDIKSSLPKLLNELLKTKGNYRVRLGMFNPNYAIKFLDELIKIYKNPNMFRFLHIPVQSGSNRILKLMKRGYTIEQYKKIIEKFRKEIPNITIITDVIVGFPTETEQEFNETVDLIKWMQPDVVNISRFWLRKGTKAETMEQVHGKISKIRSQKMKKMLDEIMADKNRKWTGWKGTALIDEYGIVNNTMIARNDFYKQIVIENKNRKLKRGMFVKVKIKNATKFDLRGEITG